MEWILDIALLVVGAAGGWFGRGKADGGKKVEVKAKTKRPYVRKTATTKAKASKPAVDSVPLQAAPLPNGAAGHVMNE